MENCSGPAKHARTLTGHLNTFLASRQAYYAGALGVAHINIMYAPYVEDMSDEEIIQEAQHLIFSSSQNAFSRGGQALFLDFNIHAGIPGHLRDVVAIGPGGKPVTVGDGRDEELKNEFVREQIAWRLDGLKKKPSPKTEEGQAELDEIQKESNYVTRLEDGRWARTYGSYEDGAARFTRAMLEVWRRGDRDGRIFPFPKCDFHVAEETFTDRRQEEILDLACRVASENGSPYFIFDRDAVVLSACCRLRTKVEDKYMLKHPESLRFCGFQNVTINLPQCALRAGHGNMDALHDEIDRMMDVAMKAHVQKKEFISHLMSEPNMPLWEMAKKAHDGRPYIDLDEATYIIGIIGLNECLHYVTGRELHDSEEALMQGLRIISYMHYKAKELGKEHGLRVSLEETPAESAARRMAKIDLQRFPEARGFVRGSIENDETYYTNSIHLRPDAPVDIVKRIDWQSRFHSLIESGAIVHAFVGEHRPAPGAGKSLVRKTWDNTQAAQITISPEFSVCGLCHKSVAGITYSCPHCGQGDVDARRVSETDVRPAGGDRERIEALVGAAADS